MILFVGFPLYEQYSFNSFTVPTVTTGGGNSGTGIALNPTTDTVYSTGCIEVGTTCPGFLFVIDGATVKLTDKIRVNGAEGVAVDQHTDMIYVAATNSVAVIDGATDQMVANITAQSGNIAVNPVTNMVYTDYLSYLKTSYGSSSFTVINGTTNMVVTTLSTTGSPGDAAAVGGGLGPGEIAVDSVSNTVYVASAASYDTGNGLAYSFVSVISGSNDTLTRNVKFTEADGSGATAIAVDSKSDKVYVATWSSGAGDVAVIDSASDSVVANIHLSSGSYGIAVDGNTHSVFTSLSGGTAVQVISGATDSIVAQATFLGHNAGQIPSELVFDSATDTLFVSSVSGSGYVSVIGGMPTS